MTSHYLTDVGIQGGIPWRANTACWSEGQGLLHGCHRQVPVEDPLGLCPEHRLEILGERTPGAVPMDGEA